MLVARKRPKYGHCLFSRSWCRNYKACPRSPSVLLSAGRFNLCCQKWDNSLPQYNYISLRLIKMCHLLLSNSLQKRRKWHQNSYKAFALAGSHAWGAAEEGDVQKVRSKSLVTKLFPLSAACILALGAEGTMASARCYFPKNKPTKVC